MSEIEAHAARLRGAIKAGEMTRQAAIDELRATYALTDVGAREVLSGDYLRREPQFSAPRKGAPGE